MRNKVAIFAIAIPDDFDANAVTSTADLPVSVPAVEVRFGPTGDLMLSREFVEAGDVSLSLAVMKC